MTPQRRSAWLASGAYVALLATLATSLYDPFLSGDDDSWAIVVVLVGAHLALGVAVVRAWVLLLPVAAAAIAFFGTGGEALSWLIPMLYLPIAEVTAALGVLTGRALRARAAPVAAVVFAAAAVPTVVAGVATVVRARSPRVPPGVQAELPDGDSLCPYPGRSAAERRADEQKVDVLLRELRRNPSALVTYTWTLAESPGEERRDTTVREVAEENLGNLRGGDDCDPPTRRRIEDALGV